MWKFPLGSNPSTDEEYLRCRKQVLNKCTTKVFLKKIILHEALWSTVQPFTLLCVKYFTLSWVQPTFLTTLPITDVDTHAHLALWRDTCHPTLHDTHSKLHPAPSFLFPSSLFSPFSLHIVFLTKRKLCPGDTVTSWYQRSLLDDKFKSKELQLLIKCKLEKTAW